MEGWTAQLDGVVTPYNEAKYKALLEKIEAVEILKSKTISIASEDRWDSEYYQKKFLQTEKKIHKIDTIKLKDLSIYIKKGIFDLPPSNYQNSGIPLIRTSEIKNPSIDFTSTVFISKKVNSENNKTILNTNDLVFTKIGAYIGDVALLPSNYSQYNFSQNVVGVKLKSPENDGPYILSFFLSNLGRNQIIRSIMLSGQGKLELKDIRNYEIPVVSKDFKIKIKELFKIKEKCIKTSSEKYLQAETLLLETLGLTGFQPNSEPINIKSFKDSFLSTGRLDAEYYQKRYDNYLELIQNYSNGFSLLTFVCELKDKNYNPEENKEYKYIELANIGTSGDITGCSISKGIDLPSRARRLVKTNDVVISSIEGSLESCALVTEEYNNALCSTGFYVINSKQINSETLLVLFKSEPMQNILKQNCSGTILTAINKTEFQNIPIPLIKKDVQKEIKDKISESFRLKKESEQLLETAKRAVEIAIEKDENAALQFIENANV